MQDSFLAVCLAYFLSHEVEPNTAETTGWLVPGQVWYGERLGALEAVKSLLVFTDSQQSLFLRNTETKKTGLLLYDNWWLCTSTSEVGAQSFRGCCWLSSALVFAFPRELNYKFIEGRDQVIYLNFCPFFVFPVYFNFNGSKIWIKAWSLSAKLLRLTTNVILHMKPWEPLKCRGNL